MPWCGHRVALSQISLLLLCCGRGVTGWCGVILGLRCYIGLAAAVLCRPPVLFQAPYFLICSCQDKTPHVQGDMILASAEISEEKPRQESFCHMDAAAGGQACVLRVADRRKRFCTRIQAFRTILSTPRGRPSAEYITQNKSSSNNNSNKALNTLPRIEGSTRTPPQNTLQKKVLILCDLNTWSQAGR